MDEHQSGSSSLAISQYGGTVGWGTVLQTGRSHIRFPMMSLEFFIDVILLAIHSPGIDSASNRNVYQEYFLGGGERCSAHRADNLSCANFLESWEPQPPGTLWACPGLFRDSLSFTFTDRAWTGKHYLLLAAALWWFAEEPCWCHML